MRYDPRRVAAIGALVFGAIVSAPGARAQVTAPPPSPQNPSPMVEHTRAHRRIAERELAGERVTFDGPLGKPVEVFVPRGTKHADALRLVINFHGSAYIPEYAVSELRDDHVVAAVNLAPGSGVYDRTFTDPAVFDSLLANIAAAVTSALGTPASFRSVVLVGFSAGHGAIRAILREPRHFARVDGVLLLDGLHTGYVPDGKVAAEGGTLDPSSLETFIAYAREAVRGGKRFMVTHSTIFPGTFASTTETTDYMVEALGVRRTPVLKWGPLGMQQISEARRGRFAILGFAGNSAPDHIDHFQGMLHFLRLLERM